MPQALLSLLVLLVERCFFDWWIRCPIWFWWMQYFLSNFVYMRVWLIGFRITQRAADRPEPQVLSWILNIDKKIQRSLIQFGNLNQLKWSTEFFWLHFLHTDLNKYYLKEIYKKSPKNLRSTAILLYDGSDSILQQCMYLLLHSQRKWLELNDVSALGFSQGRCFRSIDNSVSQKS